MMLIKGGTINSKTGRDISIRVNPYNFNKDALKAMHKVSQEIFRPESARINSKKCNTENKIPTM